MPEPHADPALELALAAGRSRTRDELFFIIANRSAGVCPYDRASVWSLDSRRRLITSSGAEPAVPDAPFAAAWSRLLRKLETSGLPARPGPGSFSDPAAWNALAEKTGGLSALWIPVDTLGAGILFERWGGAEFSGGDAARLERLAAAYGLIGASPGRPRISAGTAAGSGRLVRAASLLALAAVLALVRTPLRVIAPCEVTARNPHLVSAPMDGVIEEVTVAPGQRVEAGDELALYDSRLMREELNISSRQVAVVKAELAEARARGFSEAGYRGRAAILEARLEQERARLEALEARFARRRITARTAGVVQLDNARAWRGRPVATGQAVMWLVDPSDTRVSLWLPQDDRIDVDMTRPIQVHLHALGGGARPASLTYVSSFAAASPLGGHAFPAEAEWLDRTGQPPLGLRGSAALYGGETSLGYWLLRRPLAALRLWLGI